MATIITITSTYPIITLLFILMLNKNNIKINTIIGILLIFAGIICCLYKNSIVKLPKFFGKNKSGDEGISK
jgi:drug/metabolite transporter (DMT)-like permease